MIGTIAKFESGTLLRSPQTWAICAVIAAIFGYLCLQSLEEFLKLQPSLALQDHPPGLTGSLSARFLATLAPLFSVLGPLFAMRSFSDEYRHQTMALWQSSPVSNASLVLGKFIGVLIPLTLLALLAAAMPAAMGLIVNIDIATLLLSAMGLLLVAASCAAIGVYFSSLTQQAMIAIVASLGLVTLLWLLGGASFTNPAMLALQQFSITNHLSGFFQGYLQSKDVLYFVLLTALFLALTVIRLGSLRNSGNQ